MPLNRMIDHTLLKPQATRAQLEAYFQEALEFEFVSVAVLPNVVALAHSYLKDSTTHVMAAICYPRGMVPTGLKMQEIEEAMRDGANEIDMVLNLSDIKTGRFDRVRAELQALRRATRGLTAKAILETSLLDDREIAAVCRLASELELDFVKTSTGFNSNAATLHAVRLMKASIFGVTRVKAAGGINSLAKLAQMVRAGAQRIGTSSGPAIIQEYRLAGARLSSLLTEEVS
jgi:deoxyribose-phosphate aldolase